MTPDRYRECLTHCDWSMRGMARYLGIAERSARRYGYGAQVIPPELEEWLEFLTGQDDVDEALTRRPAPDGWKAPVDANVA